MHNYNYIRLYLVAKKEKLFFILRPIKIIFVPFFFFLFLYSLTGKTLRQKHSQLSQLSPLCLTAAGPTRPQRHRATESRRHRPTTWPTSSNSQADPSPKPPIHASDPRLRSAADPRLRPISAFSDALNSLKLTLSNSHLSVPPPPPPIHASDPTRLQVSCLCLLHLHAWDFWFG